MKRTYIFGGGDSDGLLGIATILRVVDDAFFSFTSPKTLPDLVSKFVTGNAGKIYFVDLAIDATRAEDLFRELTILPDFRTYFFDQHNLPKRVTKASLPFDVVSIDPSVSSCENAYAQTGCPLDVMIPAIASLNDGLTNTEMIRQAEAKHGERLHKNAKILKYGLAFNIKDNKFKNQLVYALKAGAYPESVDELVLRHGQGLQRFDEIKRMGDERRKVLTHLAYGYFPNLKGGFANMLAGYLAESSEKQVAACVLETTRGWQKVNVICNDAGVNIGKVVRGVAASLEGAGGGSASSAGATVRKKYMNEFLKRLDQRLYS